MTLGNSSKGANAHIREYLDYYCHLSNPKFAVLLKGPWGSGKTWLIKKFMDDFKLIKDLNQSTSNSKFLYVSLYGMQTLEEVEREFLRQLHPVLGSHEVEFLAKSISAAIPLHLNSFLDNLRVKSGLTLKNLPGYLKNVDQRILIFDDLERCHVEIDHVLGYINSFIEHKSARVIIVANEEELNQVHNDENQNQERKYQYQCIKEKVIGQTLEIEFSLQEIIESLIKDLHEKNLIENEEISVFIESQAQIIETIYRYTGYKNIRTLRKIILDLNRIWVSLPANVIQKKESIQELFELLIIFSIEISQGNINSTDLYQIYIQYQKLCMRQNQSPDPNQPESNIHKSVKKYINFLREYLSRGSNLFPIDRWWGEFFDKGVSNKQLLEQSIQYSPYFRNENTESWLKLYQYKTLTDTKFAESLSDIENQFFGREIDEPEVTIHVFGTLLELVAIRLSQKTFADLEDAMKSYIKQWRESGVFLNFSKSLLKNQTQSLQIFDLEVKGQDCDSFKTILSYIIECNHNDQKVALQQEAQDLLQVMENSPNEFQSMINTFIDERNNYRSAKYHNIAILQLIDVQDFVKAFLSLEPIQQNLIVYAIIKRHELDRRTNALTDGYALTDEYEWIRKIIESLRVEMFNRKKIPLPSGFILEDHILNLEGEFSQFIDMNPEKFD
jgi:hypothetical protein